MKWASEAVPQSPRKVQRAPSCPEVVTDAGVRGINSIVHFTHFSGLKGILASSAVKARRELPKDKMVEYVFEPNAADRKYDKAWLSYVNLSVTEINMRMFGFSMREHPSKEWVILEFGPQILGDRGVVFCTTNNIYPAAHRCRGLEGFKQMFAPRVPGRYGELSVRTGKGPNQTTDPQAEVLYPQGLSLEHLHTITVRNEQGYDAVIAALTTLPKKSKIQLDPEAFR